MPRVSSRADSARVTPADVNAVDQIKQALNARYAALNELWKKAEDHLRQLMVPVDVWYLYDSYTDTSDPEIEQRGFKVLLYLGWIHTSSGWHICVGEEHEYRDVGTHWTPISDASIQLRKECVKHFPSLREKLIERAQRLIPELDCAINSLSKALD